MARRRREVLMGNEAIALGLLEGGCEVVTGYPGTPSSEILPAAISMSRSWALPLYAEWSTNEKVAFDQAYAAAMVGKRAACCMKQVGLNVACDSLMSSAYTGVEGGFLIVSCDDPGPHSSQTEQDSRRMAWTAKVPVLDPSCPQEARSLARKGLEISERFKIPVMLRSVTRLSHGRQDMTVGQPPPPNSRLKKACFKRNPARWAATPRFRFLLHKELNLKLKRLERVSEKMLMLRGTLQGKKRMPLGIVAGGVPALVAKELLEEEGLGEIPLLTVGMPFPFPRRTASQFLEACEKVLVLEEPDSFLEFQLQEWARVLGRASGHVPAEGELLPEVIWEVMESCLREVGLVAAASRKRDKSNLLGKALQQAQLPGRRPTLCAGCPHRASFYAIRRAFPKAIYPSDIGCYTLGSNLGGVDTVLDMGSGITLASGIYQAFHLDGVEQPIIATMGDSTFYHSGTAALINAVHNKARFVLVLLDNQVTAMTGMQSTPAWDKRADGSPGNQIPLERLVQGCGVDSLEVCDPYDLKAMVKALKRAWQRASSEQGGVSVVVARHPCLLHQGRSAQKGALPRVLTERCKACRHCVEAFECPALAWDEAEGRAMILEPLCVGCNVCVLVCPRGAIQPNEEVGR